MNTTEHDWLANLKENDQVILTLQRGLSEPIDLARRVKRTTATMIILAGPYNPDFEMRFSRQHGMEVTPDSYLRNRISMPTPEQIERIGLERRKRAAIASINDCVKNIDTLPLEKLEAIVKALKGETA